MCFSFLAFVAFSDGKPVSTFPENALGKPGKPQRETCASRCPVFDGDACAVHLGNALHDREAEARAACPTPIAAPEATKEEFALAVAYAGTAIEHADRTVLLDHQLDGCSFSG